MGDVSEPTSGVAVFVDGENGEGSLPVNEAVVYVGPARPENSFKNLWVPFASTSFAFRRQHSPGGLLPRGRPQPAAKTRSVAYLAANCAAHREAAFRAFRAVGAEALGRCDGARAGSTAKEDEKPASRLTQHYMDEAVAVFEPFKFVMSFENANVSGYVTEKIVNAYLARAVPIYWGSPDVFKIFNAASFLYVPDFASMEEVAQRVETMSHAEWEAMQQAPPLADGAEHFFSWHRDVTGGLRREIVDAAVASFRKFKDDNV